MGIDIKLCAMLILDFVVCSNYSLPLPFLPGIAENEYMLSKTEIGLIFGAFAIGNLLCSVIVGKVMGSVGKKKLIKLSLYVVTLSTLGLGFLIYIPKSEKIVFLVLAMLLRFISGCATGGVITILCALLPIMYED
jgi:MFS family permease